MASQTGPPVVAILNTNDDTVEMIRMYLESEGLLGVSLHMSAIRRGGVDFGAFLEEHDPRVIVLDLPPPYDRSWMMYEHLRALPAAKGRKFVLTSTNPARLTEIAKTDQPVLEIIGKPYDLQAIVAAVRRELDS